MHPLQNQQEIAGTLFAYCSLQLPHSYSHQQKISSILFLKKIRYLTTYSLWDRSISFYFCIIMPALCNGVFHPATNIINNASMISSILLCTLSLIFGLMQWNAQLGTINHCIFFFGSRCSMGHLRQAFSGVHTQAHESSSIFCTASTNTYI